MSGENTVVVMRRVVAEIFNARNLDAADMPVAADWIGHRPPARSGAGTRGVQDEEH